MYATVVPETCTPRGLQETKAALCLVEPSFEEMQAWIRSMWVTECTISTGFSAGHATATCHTQRSAYGWG